VGGRGRRGERSLTPSLPPPPVGVEEASGEERSLTPSLPLHRGEWRRLGWSEVLLRYILEFVSSDLLI